MHDDVIATSNGVHKFEGNRLAHAAQVHEGLAVGQEFDHAGRDGETHAFQLRPSDHTLAQAGPGHPGLTKGEATVARGNMLGLKNGQPPGLQPMTQAC